MPTRYRCDSCGWAGTDPLPVADVLGGALWRSWLCPRCWAEVWEVSEPPSARP
jgi:rubredoxin